MSEKEMIFELMFKTFNLGVDFGSKRLTANKVEYNEKLNRIYSEFEQKMRDKDRANFQFFYDKGAK